MDSLLYIFQAWDIVAVCIVINITVILGFIVYFGNNKSATHRSFLGFSLLVALWGTFNYISYQSLSLERAFFILRLTLFSVTWMTFYFFLFATSFPNENSRLPKLLRWILKFWTTIVSYLTLTSLVLEKVNTVSVEGAIASVTNGPMMPVFGMTTSIYVLIGIIFLLYKTIRSDKENRARFLWVTAGVLIMFVSIITTNFIFPVLFNNSSYLPFAALFVFPFIAFTSYAIIKYRLLNIRVVGVEIFIVLLLLINLIQLIQARSTSEVLTQLISYIGLVVVSVLILRSVLKEVEAREKIQVLAKQLEGANEKLKQADQAKSEFLSIAAHQLRTPLTAIKGYISMFLEGDYGKFTPEQTTELESIFRSADRLTRLIDVFLNVSRIETGRLDLKKEPVQYMEIVEAVHSDLAQQAAKKGLKLTIQPPSEPLPLMMLDRDKIHDVTMNLVDNAIKYTPSGWVNIRISRTPSLLTFQVQDSGMGISAEDIDKLFQKFTRAEAVTRIHTGGSGLGLFIAKKIVEAHGGRIWIESEGVGKGSIFNYTLPITTSSPADLSAVASAKVGDKAASSLKFARLQS